MRRRGLPYRGGINPQLWRGIVAGTQNTIRTHGDSITGGVKNSTKILGSFNSIVGGSNNHTGGGPLSVFAGGIYNGTGGAYNCVTLGGYSNNAQNYFNVIVGGQNNICSGQYSVSLGGFQNLLSTDWSLAPTYFGDGFYPWLSAHATKATNGLGPNSGTAAVR